MTRRVIGRYRTRFPVRPMTRRVMAVAHRGSGTLAAMEVLLIAVLSGLGFLVAYHTYGRWLGARVFRLAAGNVNAGRREGRRAGLRADEQGRRLRAPLHEHRRDRPDVGPAIAVLWGWLPALLWVVFGSIFVGRSTTSGASS